jgi:bacterioferritin-associated ferredoxin
MYVCICHAVTEDDVRGYVTAGARSAKEVRAACGMRPACGSCTKRLCALVSRHGTAADLVEPLPVLGADVVTAA